MKEKIIQLKKLLSDINEEISKQTYIETINVNDLHETLHETMSNWQTLGVSKAQRDSFVKQITNRISEESLKLFYENNLPALKSLLTTTLKNIRVVEKKRTENSNTCINILHANRDFKNLLEKHLLTSEQEIFGTFKKQTFWGHLTSDGFFELDMNGEKILCPNFKYATFIAWDKIVPNDGWYVWSAIDNKTGKTKSLNYFRDQLRKFQ